MPKTTDIRKQHDLRLANPLGLAYQRPIHPKTRKSQRRGQRTFPVKAVEHVTDFTNLENKPHI